MTVFKSAQQVGQADTKKKVFSSGTNCPQLMSSVTSWQTIPHCCCRKMDTSWTVAFSLDAGLSIFYVVDLSITRPSTEATVSFSGQRMAPHLHMWHCSGYSTRLATSSHPTSHSDSVQVVHIQLVTMPCREVKAYSTCRLNGDPISHINTCYKWSPLK